MYMKLDQYVLNQKKIQTLLLILISTFMIIAV